MNKKVALTRNRLDKGGVFRVMIEMISVLNEAGIKPDIITLESKVDQDEVKSLYGREVQFNIREISTDIRMPYEWHILWFNWLSSFYTKPYDVVINHNNTSFLYNKRSGHKLVSYVHFPRKYRGLSRLESIHKPHSGSKKWTNIRGDFLKATSFLYQFNYDTTKNDLIIANSYFTKKAFLEVYDCNSNQISVNYPPVDIPDSLSHPEKKPVVLSLGRFSPEKRHFEQLKIASHLPDKKFTFIGFKSDEKYYKKLEKFVSEKNLKNVYLLANAEYKTVKKHLAESAWFLHSMIQEPFGITTVQAITNGCIPVVSNTGGQKEIVNNHKLRYDEPDEAVQIIKNLDKMTTSEVNTIRTNLFEHVKKYDRREFRKKWSRQLHQLLA